MLTVTLALSTRLPSDTTSLLTGSPGHKLNVAKIYDKPEMSQFVSLTMVNKLYMMTIYLFETTCGPYFIVNVKRYVKNLKSGLSTVHARTCPLSFVSQQ